MNTVEHVDLQRFMGDWFVIASVPTIFDKAPYCAIERYALNPDGTVQTTYIYRDGGPDGQERQMSSKGIVRNRESNAEWGMQFVWPIRADYRVVYLEDDYSVTVIGRAKCDYVWIMARSPDMDEGKLEELLSFAESLGYDRDRIRRIPHLESERQQSVG